MRRRRLVQGERRGSVVVVALWAIALGAIVIGAAQISASRQALLGRQAVERVRARWAARAGVEATIAAIAWRTEHPDEDDALAIYRDVGEVAQGDLALATWDIRHVADGREWSGPMDEHAKININAADPATLLAVPNMDPTTIDSIRDWVDEDDQVTGAGAEAPQYAFSDSPFTPRNAPMHHLAEMELVYGVQPAWLRGEDWNLNARLDPNEADGDLVPPEDNRDDALDAAWSSYLTASSVARRIGDSGEPMLYLPEATPEEIQERLGVDRAQAEALLHYAGDPANTLAGLWVTSLSSVQQDGSVSDENMNSDVLPLNTDHYRTLLGEATLANPAVRVPGKVNINTASEDVLRALLGHLDPAVVDEILSGRRNRAGGYTSLVDLLETPNVFFAQVMADVTDLLDTKSSVFTITATGRSKLTGQDVQLVVEVDRSTLPVKILSYREE